MIYENLSCRDVEKLRIVEKLKSLDALMIRRVNSEYDSSLSWIENALQENEKLAFEKIIAQQNPDHYPGIILGIDVDDETIPAPSGVVKRDSYEFALALKLLLQCCENIILIDPHFRAEEPRFSNVLRKFFEVSEKSSYKRNSMQFELHTRIDSGENIEQRAETRVNNMREYLKDVIPPDQSLKVYIWEEKIGGEKFHNRYVLTESGGVSFGTGLDAANPDTDTIETDDILRLDKKQYAHRYKQFKGIEPAFNLIIETEIKS